VLPCTRVDGRRFVTEPGQPFAWRGAIGVRVIEKVARGQQADISHFFTVLADQWSACWP